MKVFAIAEPEEHRQHDESYLTSLRDVGLRTDHPIYLRENITYQRTGRFENLHYDELPELVEHADEIFISAYPEALSQIPEYVDLESEKVYLDRRPLDAVGLEQPTRFEILKDQASSLLPYKGSNIEVEYSSPLEILRQQGLEEANLKTAGQFLGEDVDRQFRSRRRRA